MLIIPIPASFHRCLLAVSSQHWSIWLNLSCTRMLGLCTSGKASSVCVGIKQGLSSMPQTVFQTHSLTSTLKPKPGLHLKPVCNLNSQAVHWGNQWGPDVQSFRAAVASFRVAVAPLFPSVGNLYGGTIHPPLSPRMVEHRNRLWSHALWHTQRGDHKDTER